MNLLSISYVLYQLFYTLKHVRFLMLQSIVKTATLTLYTQVTCFFFF